jgi:hypothetical protein
VSTLHFNLKVLENNLKIEYMLSKFSVKTAEILNTSSSYPAIHSMAIYCLTFFDK